MKDPRVIQDKVSRIYDKLQINERYRFSQEELSLIKEAAMLDLLTSSQLRGLILVLCEEYVVNRDYTSE
jgi:hypothetical protein